MHLRTEKVALSPVGDELMLLDLEASTYFAVSSTGAVVVELLRTTGGAEVGDLVAALVERFGVDEGTARADVLGFLASLREAGLVRE